MVDRIVNQNSHFELILGIINFILLAATGTILGLWGISRDDKSKVFYKKHEKLTHSCRL